MKMQFHPRKRLYTMDDEFFNEGNLLATIVWHKTVFQGDFLEDQVEFNVPLLRCNFCEKVFQKGIQEYESHYQSFHNFECKTCNISLPTAYWLSLHITESHDNYFKACLDQYWRKRKSQLEEIKNLTNLADKSEKDLHLDGNIFKRNGLYQCLVESCSKCFETPRARNRHCHDKHGFDPSLLARYRKSIKSKSGKKRHSSKSTINEEPLIKQNNNCDMDIDAMTEDLAKVKIKIPKKISFGNRRK